MQFEITRNDITNMAVDAIVLPANLRLREGSGTSKAIFEKAGRKELEKACKGALKNIVNSIGAVLFRRLPLTLRLNLLFIQSFQNGLTASITSMICLVRHTYQR